MNRAAPSHHAAAAARRRGGSAHGTPALVVVVILLILLLCCGCCDAKLLRALQATTSDEESSEGDVILTASNVCLKSIVNQQQLVYHKLDVSKCLQDPSLGLSYVEVEARIFQQCADNHQWSVFVNTQGQKVNATPDEYTFVHSLAGPDFGLYGHLDIPITKVQNASQPWMIGFYSSCGPVQYNLKSWCSASKGCNLSCSDPDSGPCVSLDRCRCAMEAGEGCDIDVELLPDEEDLITRYTMSHIGDRVQYGTWKYIRFQAFDNASRSMVELERAYGDIVLFVKRDTRNGTEEEDDDNTDGLPIEQDAAKYADLPSFQNRLSHHSRFVNGSGFFYVGVYNSDTCLQEDSTFNVTITTVVPADGLTLCPKNCSFPRGVCVQDNVCKCNPGYGGQYCDGSVAPAASREVYSGQLEPGEWAYINMTAHQMREDIDVSVTFRSSTGHPILLAQQNGDFPTLTSFHLKFSNSTLGRTPNDTYRISGASVILGVFNVDYMHRGVSQFELIIIGSRRELAIWLIILMAIASSIFLVSMALTVRHLIQRRGQHPSGSRMNMDFEATPQDLEMVQHRHQDTLMISTLPLLAFQRGLLPKEDAGCSICLNNYNVGEIVCRLPGCKHVFHVRCLEEWFRKDGSCPLCRVPLQDQGVESSPDPPVHPSSSLLLQSPSSSG